MKKLATLFKIHSEISTILLSLYLTPDIVNFSRSYLNDINVTILQCLGRSRFGSRCMNMNILLKLHFWTFHGEHQSINL